MSGVPGKRKTVSREKHEIKTITMVDGWRAVFEMSAEDYGPEGPGRGWISCGRYKSYPIAALAVADLIVSRFNPETGLLLSRENLGPDVVGLTFSPEPGFGFEVVDDLGGFQSLLEPGYDLKSWIDFSGLGSGGAE